MTPAERIKRLNRLYAVSSGINEAIVRVPDEMHLYEEACRIAVERGGFMMAWVGLNDDMLSLLRPVARWGKDDGYVDSIRITTSDLRREGRGPGGTAYRTGQPAVCNDIAADTDYFAFRQEALARGYRSCAAFPLKLEGRPFGVFLVYADEPLYFDEDELALLASLADNFSFAIEARQKDAERRRMENALRSSETRLRAVIDNEPECVKTLSLDGHLLDINPAGLAMIEAPTLASVLGLSVADFIHPDDQDAWRALHAQVVAGGTGRMNVRAIGLGGKLLWMDTHAVPLRAEDGSVSTVLYLTRDVTHERASLQRLQHSQALLSMASRLGRIGAWEVDVASSKITWSDELVVIHEMPPGFSPSFEQAMDFYAPEHRDTIAKAFTACLRHGTPFDLELEILARSGRRVCVRAIGEAVRGVGGDIYQVQGALQDISERKIAEDEIRQLAERLEHRVRQRTAQLETANTELQAFSYSVAHDLRAPLAAISGFAHAIEHALAGAGSDKVPHYLSRLKEGVLRTSDMIDALLSLAQLSRDQLRWESVDLSAMAHAVIESCRQQEPQRAGAWQVQSGLAAEGDPRLLRLVLDNLLGNAWKFTAGQEQARIELGALEGPEGETVYFVRDNGVGFDPQYAGKLFGAFQRLHPQAEFAGTGIGLANVRRIISRHSGRVWAESRPGEGATFYFTLGSEPA